MPSSDNTRAVRRRVLQPCVRGWVRFSLVGLFICSAVSETNTVFPTPDPALCRAHNTPRSCAKLLSASACCSSSIRCLTLPMLMLLSCTCPITFSWSANALCAVLTVALHGCWCVQVSCCATVGWIILTDSALSSSPSPDFFLPFFPRRHWDRASPYADRSSATRSESTSRFPSCWKVLFLDLSANVRDIAPSRRPGSATVSD